MVHENAVKQASVLLSKSAQKIKWARNLIAGRAPLKIKYQKKRCDQLNFKLPNKRTLAPGSSTSSFLNDT